jgi:hypothetical protein
MLFSDLARKLQNAAFLEAQLGIRWGMAAGTVLEAGCYNRIPFQVQLWTLATFVSNDVMNWGNQGLVCSETA